MIKIGIVGCGTIGAFLAKRIARDLKKCARLTAICDADTAKAKSLTKKLKSRVSIMPLDKLIERCDLIIEAASASACPIVCRKAIARFKDIMVMSVGGLLGNEDIFSLAKKRGSKIICPSGAICGLDGLKSAAAGKIKKVTLTTRKPPQGLKGAPYVVKNNIDLDTITKEQVIFEGTAKEAVKGFPANVNVSAVLSLAGIGADKTRVKIVTSPEYMVNTHEVEVEGDFGRLITRTENVPFPENPKTSFLAALSALATLKQIFDGDIRIGT